MTRNGHRHQGCNRIHRQRAVSGGDVVVVSLRAVIQRVGERVGGFTRVELAARHIVGRTLAVREAVATHRHVAVGQRRAVVGLAGRGGGQRHVTSVHAQLAVHRLSEGVVGRHIRRAAHHLVAGHHVGHGVHMRHRALDRSRQHIVRLQHTLSVGIAAVGQRRTVVLLVLGSGGDDNRGVA